MFKEPFKVYYHEPAREDRVQPDVLWIETEYGRANPSRLGLEDHNDVQVTDGADLGMGVRVFYGISERCVSLYPYKKDFVDSTVYYTGCCRLIYEVGNRFYSDHVLLFVQGEDDIGVMLEPIHGGIVWGDSKEDKFK